MAFDEELAERFRKSLEGMAGISEKRMMGGICFFLDGNMIGGADRNRKGERRFLFRVGKENAGEALSRPGAEPARIGDRVMGGFVFVDESDCEGDAMKDWVSLALGFVSTLPPKDNAGG